MSNKLKKVRRDHLETREMLAKKLNVSVSAISKWETGNRIPKDCHKREIAKHYKMKVEDLFFSD